jgi:hypothetical protein
MDAATELAARREDGDAEGVHRLRDIVVEEVSLVDRAANKRRFLVVKRSDDMADDESATAGDEDVEKATKKKPAASEGKTDEEKRRKPAAAKDEADAEKARAVHDDDEDDEVDDAKKTRRSEDDEEDDAEKAKSPDDSEDDEEEKKAPRRKQEVLTLPATVKEATLRVLTEALERLMTVASRIKQATETAEEAALPNDVLGELGAIAELLGKVGAGKSRAAKAAVAKAGARMSKDRLDRFQKAMAALAEILKELTDSKDAPVGPTAGAAESGVKKRDAGGAPAAVLGLAELVTGISDLTRVVKRQEEELTRIRQVRGVSNAISVDGARRKEPEDVSWPMDMNRPISRDKVKKEVSFFDEE